jgi:hypothetical protein
MKTVWNRGIIVALLLITQIIFIGVPEQAGAQPACAILATNNTTFQVIVPFGSSCVYNGQTYTSTTTLTGVNQGTFFSQTGLTFQVGPRGPRPPATYASLDASTPYNSIYNYANTTIYAAATVTSNTNSIYQNYGTTTVPLGYSLTASNIWNMPGGTFSGPGKITSINNGGTILNKGSEFGWDVGAGSGGIFENQISDIGTGKVVFAIDGTTPCPVGDECVSGAEAGIYYISLADHQVTFKSTPGVNYHSVIYSDSAVLAGILEVDLGPNYSGGSVALFNSPNIAGSFSEIDAFDSQGNPITGFSFTNGVFSASVPEPSTILLLGLGLIGLAGIRRKYKN